MQLKNANDRLVKSERLAAIGELAGMVGHDLRNPLAGMRGATYYLKTKYGEKMADDGKKMLKTIDECISYSDKIINDLLDYSREIQLDLTESTPEQMVKNALAHIEVPERIRLTNTAENGPILKADKEKMIRVFVNLIKNAFDAMPEGGSLKIRNEKAKSKVTFIFEDTGAGMTKETMLKLWTPLFTTKAKGMGFGLAICKRIVEAHGGTISVESTIGEGTKMTVTLPVNPKKVVSSEETWVVDHKVLPLTAIPK
jgi:signal transduction histidine kinase